MHPIADQEAQRLAALDSYHILDSLPEQHYEDITLLAAQICAAPVALITLVDAERQWFKSNRGLSFRQTPREDSFCAHNLSLLATPLIVEDARLDERFKNNPLVTGEPNIVFYAGEPLIDPDGMTMGSLCVIDSHPRRLEAGQLAALSILARQVVTLLTARRKAVQEVILQQKLRASEARFQDLVSATPAATAVFVGRDMLIQQINAPMLAIWGKDASVTGKTLCAAMPELIDQPFLAQLQHVFDSGEPFFQAEGMAQVIEDGQPRHVWFNHAYNPLYDEQGQIYGVIAVALDVTSQVTGRQLLEQAQQALQNAVDLAQLGIWKVDVATQAAEFSPLVQDWVGSGEPLTLDRAVAAIDPADLPAFQAAFAQAHLVELGGSLSVKYHLTNQQTGQIFLLQSRGQMQFNAAGQPVSLSGFSWDITQLRAAELALENRVRERTEELRRANQDLTRSNENLQQFAYVASHDLQEPLRKIQSFSSLLIDQLGDHPANDHLQRIITAGARMSTLIKDLLTYSRISTRQQTFGPVSLSAVMTKMLSMLDWEIEQTGARVEVSDLPVVNGDELQLGQLFQNLMTNAIKFVKPGQAPQIQIRYAYQPVAQLPAAIRPPGPALFYHQISVQDQGIGFDQKYLDRIFQVFQRLHGKSSYPGTGVGLAICHRVASNHGGVITAGSQPGYGATFWVYLPA